MDNKIEFLFGVHMHQPVDNFDEAVDEAVQKCYKPFFQTVKKYPFFKFSLHCSGWLLKRIKHRYKSVFQDIKELSDSGNIEFFTAGFYEPVLCSIPAQDRVDQIKKLNHTIKKYFDKSPKGLWLTERVWEDGIILDLKSCGIEYVIIDDYHLLASGYKSEEGGYYFSENGGERIALFPIDKELRYAIPFKDAKKSIEEIKKVSKKSRVAVLFDDAEKFGLWPETFEWVYEKGWLEEFLSELEKDKEIQSVHFGEHFKNHRAKGLIYLQNLSYEEMGEWSLNSKDALEFEKIKEFLKDKYKDVSKFVKGSTWKNFFSKYEESNRLHKRMIELSKCNIEDKKFKESLMKLQTNDVFWHGVFGGLYLPNLRDNAYRYLCECENIRYKHKKVLEAKDINMDGFDRIKAVENGYIAIFDAKNGGQMSELLLRDKMFNLQNTLTRREEIYHKEILQDDDKKAKDNKEAIDTIHTLKVKVDDSIKEALSFDWYIKNSFIDHISNDSFTLENFKKCKFWEYGDFANQPFTYSITDNKIIFKREGGIYFNKKYDTTITKSYLCGKKGVDFKIGLKTKSPKRYRYALEFNLHFANLKDLFWDDISIDKNMDIKGIKSICLKDNYLKKIISFSLKDEFQLFISPLTTVSKSEKGYDMMVQGISLAFVYEFSGALELEGSLEIENV